MNPNHSKFSQRIKGIFTEVVRTATSKELLKKHLATPLYQNAYYLMASTAITSILGFVSLIIATRFYSTEAVGLSSAIIAALGLIALFAELGLGIGLIRFLPGAGKNSNDMLNACLTISGLASIAIALIFLVGLDFWSPALLPVRQNAIFFSAFVIFAVITALQPLVADTFLARRNTKFILISNIIAGLSKLALVILFATFLNNAFGIFTSSGLSTAIALVIAVIWFLPKVQSGYRPIPKIKKEVLNKLGHYSVGNYIGRILLQMTPSILPLMVINILGAEMSAYFHVAWAVVSVLLVIPSSIFNSLFAEGSNDEASLRANITKSLKLMLLLLLPATLLILMIAGKLLLLFGQTYSDSGALLLRILALSVIPWGINYLYVSIARVTKNVSGVIKVAGLSTGFSLGLSYFLMLKMSLAGVGIGYIAGQSIVAIAVVIYLRRGYSFQPQISSMGVNQ